MADDWEAQQIYILQPKHPHQHHTAWHQIIAQELCTIEQRPINKGYMQSSEQNFHNYNSNHQKTCKIEGI